MQRLVPTTLLSLVCLACLALAASAADPFLDVTTKVAAMVKDNALSVAATNDNFTDPAEGTGKKLRVEYTVNGAAGSKTCAENETLAISAVSGKKLVVTKATYGDLPDKDDVNAPGVELFADVLAKVKETVQGNKLSLTASNDALGCDPAFGIGKQLRVDYTVDGKAHSATANEGDDLKLPADGDGTGPLVIVKARYGAAP